MGTVRLEMTLVKDDAFERSMFHPWRLEAKKAGERVGRQTTALTDAAQGEVGMKEPVFAGKTLRF